MSAAGMGTAGQNMQIIGGLVTMGGHFGEAWHHYRANKVKSKQTRYDAAAIWNNLQMQADALQNDRIYNANVERRIAEFQSGENREALSGSGLSGGTLDLLQASKDAAAEIDVRERSRQNRENIKLLRHDQNLTLIAARNMRKALRQERDLKVTNSIISGLSGGFTSAMSIVGGKMGSMGGGGGEGASSAGSSGAGSSGLSSGGSSGGAGGAGAGG